MKKLLAVIFVCLACALCAVCFTACGGDTGNGGNDGGNSSGNDQNYSVFFIVGEERVATVTTKGEERITLPADPETVGYEFDGWFFDREWELPCTADSLLNTQLNGSISVYAKMTPIEYVASFYAEGKLVGTATFTVKDSTVQYAPEVPDKEGHSGEWESYTIAAGGLTINAVYVPMTYTVSWINYNGDPLETDENVPYGTTPEYNGEAPERDDSGNRYYTFDDWDCGFDEDPTGIVPVTGDTVYYARFSSHLYCTVSIQVSTMMSAYPIYLINSNQTSYEGKFKQGEQTPEIQVIKCPTYCEARVYTDANNDEEYFVAENYVIPSFTVEGSVTYRVGCAVKEELNAYEWSATNYSCTITSIKDKSVTEVEVPDGVTEIAGAFKDCTALTTITIPDSVTHIGYESFNNCTSLTEITIPDSVTSIGIESTISSYGTVFYGCTALTEINLSKNLTYIASGLFSGCSALTSVTIPESATSIGRSAFSGCSSLRNVIIPDGVTAIGEYAFSKSGLTSIIIPDSVTSIDMYAFKECVDLTYVKISDQLDNLDRLFWGCTNLTSIVIPVSVTSISYLTFSGCNNLETVYYGGTATEWGEVLIGEYNDALSSANVYYYSETEPAGSGYWHYINGTPYKWQ